MSDIPTIQSVIDAHVPLAENRAPLVAALIEREDLIADELRLAGANLGAMPEFVAKVLADIGIGTPISEEGRVLIDHQFIQRMQWLEEQFRQQRGE